MSRVFYIIFIIILISTCFISGLFIYMDCERKNRELKVFQDIVNNIEEKQESKIEEKKDINIVEELYKQNNDIVAWLKVDGTNIDYPIMQTKDNPNYYLNKNFYKEYSILGTPYLAEQCDLYNSDNLILYGHNIKGNKMFAELERYKSEKFYRKHKFIDFCTVDGLEEYEVVCVFKTVAHIGFEYYKYTTFKKKSEFDTFFNKCKELAFYNIDTNVNFGDKLLTLSTCEYSQKDGRLVVICKKI